MKFIFFALAGFLSVSQAARANFNDCKTITPAQLNAHPEDCGNERMTADCLAAFDAKDISHTCIEKLSDKNLEDMQAKTVKDITSGNKEHLPKTIKFWRYLLNKFKSWNSDKSKDIIIWLVEDESFMDKLLSDASVPHNLAAHLITKESSPKMKPAACGKLSVGIAKSMDHDAFTNITNECFSSLRPEFFEGLDSITFKDINPKAFEAITSKQAEKIPTTAVKDMSEVQAEHWGMEPKIPSANPDAPKTDYNAQKAARAKYIDEHPCSKIGKWIESTPEKTRRALHKRCDHVLKESSAIAMAVPSGLLIAFLTLSLLTFAV